MGNQSSNRPNQGMKRFGEMLKSANEAARQKKQIEDDPFSELPKPHVQTVLDDRFEWTWNVEPGFVVIATLDRVLQSWMIELLTPAEHNTLDLLNTKKIGLALIAASTWKDNWKVYFADYMLGEAVNRNLRIAAQEEGSGKEHGEQSE